MDYTAATDLLLKAREHCDHIFMHLVGQPNPRASGNTALRWHDDGKLLLNLAGDKRGTWHNFSTGEHGDVCDFVQAELSLTWWDAVAWIDRWFGSPNDLVPSNDSRGAPKKNTANCAPDTKSYGLELFHAANPSLQNTIAYRYLQKRLHGFLPEEVVQGGSLRFSPTHRKMAGVTFVDCVGALLALMTDPKTGEATGVHRTFINSKLERIERATLGTQGVVRLFPDHAVETALAVGEGIETCLSAHLLLDGPPVWSCLNTGGLSMMPVLHGIAALTIYADNDENQAGQISARKTFERWRNAGAEVTLHLPMTQSADFNTMLADLVSFKAAE
nr:toprim domain-containing protein [uncultured Devosia sp.]